MRAVATMIAMAGCLALVWQAPAEAQGAEEAGWQKRLFGEIVQMRAELAEYLLEARQSNISSLERELREVREQQKALQENEHQQHEHIAQIDRQLASAELELEARPQLEAARAQLSGPEVERLRNVQTTLAQRETDIIGLLERERLRAQALRERARLLSSK